MSLERALEAMRRRPATTCAGIVLYMGLTVPTHDLVQQVFFAWRDLVGLRIFHVSVPALGLVALIGVGRPVIRRGGWRLRRWWAWIATLIVGSFVLLIAVGSEVVHFPQYALLAIPLFALTGSAVDTVALATVLGAVDEGYQYLVLNADWPIYFDFNDVLINAIGAGLGVVWLLSAIPGKTGRRRWRPADALRGAAAAPGARLLLAGVAAVALLVGAGLVAIDAPWNADGAYASLNRGGVPGEFWTNEPWAGKPFHILRPVPGTALLLLVSLSFAGLDLPRGPAGSADARRRRSRLAVTTVAALLVGAAVTFPALGRPPAGDELVERRLDWFADQKLGLLVHWGIYSVWGAVESWPIEASEGYGREPGFEPWDRTGHDLERFRRDYFALQARFDPVDFDPTAWARAARQAGMRYMIFTAKHHDGFSMYDTAATDFRVTGPGSAFADDPRADVLRRVLDAFRDEGLAVGIHYSKADWHHPDYWIPDRPKPDRRPNYDPDSEPERWRRFVEFTHRQVKELMSEYGPVDLLELDGGWIRAPTYDIEIDRLVETARFHQPELLVADRAVGGRHENFRSAEWRIPEEPLPAPWEMHVPVGWQMSFDFDDHYRPMPELIRLLVETVAKGGNLALGVGPRPDGTLPPQALQRMRQLGDWLQVNGAAIYGTRMADPYRQGDVFFTRGEDAIFAIAPDDGTASPPGEIELLLPAPAEDAQVRMLGVETPLRWEHVDGRLTVRIPRSVRERPPSSWAWALRIPRRDEP